MRRGGNYLGNNKDKPEVQNLLEQYSELFQDIPQLGEQYETREGGILTIVGWDGVTKAGKRRKLTCHCSICSLDQELHPKGSLKITKDKLMSGRQPCSCSWNTKWSERQNKIRVLRECEKRGYIFHGWSAEYKTQKTRLDLENPLTGNRWITTTINDFLLNGSGDPCYTLKAERAIAINKKPDEEHIKDFFKNWYLCRWHNFQEK